MFSALRQGSPLYVLDKGNLTLRVGSVESTTLPVGLNNMPWMQQPFDATVKYDDGTTEKYQSLQPNLSVGVYGSVVVTETKELMAQEVEQMQRQSKGVIDSVDYHTKVLSTCEEMMKQLSPAFAKEKETDDRLNSLEKGLGDIKTMLAKALGKSS